jgi:hypothetical protein
VVTGRHVLVLPPLPISSQHALDAKYWSRQSSVSLIVTMKSLFYI